MFSDVHLEFITSCLEVIHVCTFMLRQEFLYLNDSFFISYYVSLIH